MYCSQRDHHSGPAGHLAPAARPSPHSHHRSCQVVDARPSGSKICRHEGDRPAVPAQRRPCPPNTARRLISAPRSDLVLFKEPDAYGDVSSHLFRHRLLPLQNETPKLAGRDRRLFRRPCAPFSDTETSPRVKKAACSRAFSTRTKILAKTRTGWLGRQDSNSRVQRRGPAHKKRGPTVRHFLCKKD